MPVLPKLWGRERPADKGDGNQRQPETARHQVWELRAGGWGEILREAGSFDLDPAACPQGRTGISRRESRSLITKKRGLQNAPSSVSIHLLPHPSCCPKLTAQHFHTYRLLPCSCTLTQTAPLLRMSSPPCSGDIKAQCTRDLPWEPC